MTRFFKKLSLSQISQTKNHVVAAFVCGLALATPMGANALGYVSRDCSLAGAKESITWDAGGNYYYLYTESLALRRNIYNGTAYWESNKSGNGYAWTKKAYAGFWLQRIPSYYLTGVNGGHWKYNTKTRLGELRTSSTTWCNLLNWGLNNW